MGEECTSDRIGECYQESQKVPLVARIYPPRFHTQNADKELRAKGKTHEKQERRALEMNVREARIRLKIPESVFPHPLLLFISLPKGPQEMQLICYGPSLSRSRNEDLICPSLRGWKIDLPRRKPDSLTVVGEGEKMISAGVASTVSQPE